MKIKIIRKSILTVILLSSSWAAMGTDTIQVNPSSIQFFGLHCEAITADDITIDTQGSGHLNINLSKMGSAKTVFHPQDCTIKIPYTNVSGSDSINSSISLAGIYTTPGLEQVITSVGVTEAGAVAKADFYLIKKSLAGEFNWKHSFELDVDPDNSNAIKVVISLMLSPQASDEYVPEFVSAFKKLMTTEPDTVPALSLTPLSLTINKVVEAPSPENKTR